MYFEFLHVNNPSTLSISVNLVKFQLAYHFAVGFLFCILLLWNPLLMFHHINPISISMFGVLVGWKFWKPRFVHYIFVHK